MMSPYVGGYFPGDEERLPILKIAPLLAVMAFTLGHYWMLPWFHLSALLNVDFLVVPWVSSSFLLGPVIYLLSCKLFIHKYKHILDNEKLNDILERARRRTNYDGRIQVWKLETEKSITVGSRTALYSTILVSERAVRSILENPRDGEILLAFRIATWSSPGAVTRVVRAGLFSFAAIAFWPVIVDPALALSDQVLVASLALFGLASLCVFISALKHWVSNPYPIHRVETLYGTPIAVSLMVLFLGPSFPRQKVQEYVERFRPSPREQDIAHKRHTLATSLFVGAAIGGGLFLSLISRVAAVHHIELIVWAVAISAVVGGIPALLLFVFRMAWPVQGEWNDIVNGRAEKEHGERESLAGPKAEEAMAHEGTPCTESKASEIETLLMQADGFQDYHVRCLDEGEEEGSFIVYRPGGFTHEYQVSIIPPELHRIMSEVGMLVPYIIYGSTVLGTQRRETRCLIPYMVLALIFGSALAPFVPINLTGDLIDYFLSAILFCSLFLIVPSLAVNTHYKSIMFKLDTDLARKYPDHVSALEILAGIGGMVELGSPSVSDRLQHLHGTLGEQS